MYNIDEIKECIQEWYSCCNDIEDIIKTYSEIRMESEVQTKFMTDVIMKNTNKENK